MPQYERPHVGWPIYGPPIFSSNTRQRPMTSPPPLRIRRPIRLPQSSADGRSSHRAEESLPACFVLQVPPISNIVYDIRCPPPTLRSAPSSPYRITGYSDLNGPFIPSRPASIRIISKEFPWAFDVYEGTRGAGVTCRDVVSILYDALQLPLTDTDWGFASDDLRQRIVRAWKRRGSLDGGLILKRVDLLGGRCRLQGFRKDEDFTGHRLFPGAQPVTDTWVACFMH